ncbi:hypothetical protein [Caldilinea sp.]|uniref:hypothetical protein n=1 Tax=Caldilinea sp. TaxID=2293560 RepID=UPI0026239F4F|nr:hypothetical protein [Caldilinea sp.]
MEEPQAYIDREGQPRASLEVTAQDIRFLSARGEGTEAPVSYSSPAEGAGMSEEEIPF